MKHFLGIITETIDGFETTNKVLVSGKTIESANKKLVSTMKNWRDEVEIEENGYFFESGTIKVTGYVQQEIPVEHFTILSKYL